MLLSHPLPFLENQVTLSLKSSQGRTYSGYSIGAAAWCGGPHMERVPRWYVPWYLRLVLWSDSDVWFDT